MAMYIRPLDRIASMFKTRIPLSLRQALFAGLLLSTLAVSLNAQSTRGTEFWVGFMAHTTQTGEPALFTLYISTRGAATGIVSIPRIGFSRPIGLPANSVTEVQLPQNLLLSLESEGIANRGVRIVTTDSVDVWAVSYVPQTMEATAVFATGALGYDYRVMAYQGFVTDAGIPLPSQFIIVATEDGTQIEITPSATTAGGRPAGVPYSITMDAGQSYQVQASHDLSGSRVISPNRRPFALFGGAARANVPSGVKFQNHLFEQMYSVDRWGTTFITVPLATRKMDPFRIMASANATTVQFDGRSVFTLNDGEYRDTILTRATVITADQPIGVVQFSAGAEFDNSFNADPFMVVVSPLDFTRNQVLLSMFPVPTVARHYVNIVAFSADVASILFDGASIAHLFQPVPFDEFYSYATVPTGAGQHTLTSELGVVASVYGYGELEGYGYSAGAERLIGCPLPTIRALGDTIFCDGSSVTLDAGPGYRKYEWSNGETTQQITVATGGEYSVITVDSNGCQKPSRPVKVTVHPRPGAEVTVLGSTTLCPCDSLRLVAPPGADHLWSNGERGDTLTVWEPGEYSVMVTNEYGCRSVSASVVVDRREVRSTVALGSDSAAPGDRVAIPLVLRQEDGLNECGEHDFLATIRFNASVLQIERFVGGNILSDTLIGSERFVIVEGSRARDTLLTLEGFAALGNAEVSGLRFIWFRWDRCDEILVDPVDGDFTLLDICRDGDPRLLDGIGDLLLKQNIPNPANGSTMVEYELVEDGPTQLLVTDVVGRTVLTVHDGYRQRGRYSAIIDVSALPSGVYYYLLQTRTHRLGRVMRVVQ